MADKKQYLSRIRLIDGTTVDIKDQEARLELKSLFEDIKALADCQAKTNPEAIAANAEAKITELANNTYTQDEVETILVEAMSWGSF